MRLFYLILGGILGTASRYALSTAVREGAGRGFPSGTLAVNVLGCLIIGFLSTVNQGRVLQNDNMQMFLAVGFCGAFTTFSTLVLETANLAKGGDGFRALLYVAVSIFAGLAAFVFGHRLGRFF